MTRVGRGTLAALYLSTLLALTGFGRAPVQSPADQPAAVPFTDAYQDGYVLALWEKHTDAELSQIIARIKQSGAKHLTIPYFGCQSTIHSADVGSCQVGDPDQALREAKIALSQGFGVTFLPIIATPNWDWRGVFDPDDVDAWFASYEAWLRKLADIANQLQLKDFIVASEFSDLYSQESRWEELLTEFHALFHGPLIVASNWDALNHDFWSYADAIGVSFYYPLSQDSAPTSDELAAGMSDAKDQLLRLSRKFNRPIHITEVGYMSVNGAATHPWNGNPQDGANPELQAQCFEAFRSAWATEPALVRAEIWATTDPDDPKKPTGFETIGKPAESVISRFFEQRAALARAGVGSDARGVSLR